MRFELHSFCQDPIAIVELVDNADGYVCLLIAGQVVAKLINGELRRVTFGETVKEILYQVGVCTLHLGNKRYRIFTGTNFNAS